VPAGQRVFWARNSIINGDHGLRPQLQQRR
jgi:hypothetical protein